MIRSAHTISRVLVWVGGSLILLSAFLVTLEVLLRRFFNISMGGADELSGYAFAIATSFAMANALFERAHIRVDALYLIFPLWLKLIASFVGLILLAGFVGFICFTAWGLVADTFFHGSRSITPMRTPLLWPQLPWLFGWLFFLFCCVLILLTALKAVMAGDTHKADELIGTKTMDEQIKDETI